MSEAPRMRPVRMLPPPRKSLDPRVVDALRLAHRAFCGLCVIAFFWMLVQGSVAWLIGSIVFACTAGVALFALAAPLRRQRESILRDRFELIRHRLLASDGQLLVRGTPTPIPLWLVLFVLAIMYMGAAPGLSATGKTIGLLMFPLLMLLWMRGARRLFPPILVFDRHGLTTRALRTLPWQDIAHVRLARSTMRYQPDLHSLIILLVHGRDPRGPLSWWQRYVRGVELGEITVPLRNPSEDRLLILALAEMLARTTPAETRRVTVPPAETRRATVPPAWQTPVPAATPPQPDEPGSLSHAVAALREIQALADDPRLRGGQQIPMPLQWAIVAVVAACAGFGVFGMKTAFYFSERWNGMSFYAAMAAALVVSMALLVKLLPRVPERSRIGTTLFLPLIVLMLSWPILICALPDLFTRFAGQPFRLEQAVSIERRSSGCNIRLHAPVFDSGPLRPYFCVSPDFAQRVAQDGRGVISGRESWFGRHVDSVATVDSLGAGRDSEPH